MKKILRKVVTVLCYPLALGIAALWKYPKKRKN